MPKKALKTVWDSVGYIIGSAFNIAVFAVIILLVFTVSSRAYDYGKTIFSDDTHEKRDEYVEFVIPEEASTTDVAAILKEAGFISNELVFRLQTKLNGTDELIRSGTYKLNLNISQSELMEELQRVQITEVKSDTKVTIPEGLTIRQIGEILEAKGFFTVDEFVKACDKVGDYDYDFLRELPKRENMLQGYLFPDTYFLPDKPTPEQVITRMLDRFDQIFAYEYRTQAENMGHTIDEIISIAAIIEKEIKVAEERELASAVIYNRLAINMELRMCSTVLYALDKPRARLLLTDLEVKSPYNTYIHAGLTPGPIASPGKASIEAALWPKKDCDYLYFVLQDPETGKHFFSSDYNAFLNAKAKYNDEF